MVLLTAQKHFPTYNKQEIIVQGDWLVESVGARAKVYQTKEGYLVLSNGLVNRTFTLQPNVASIELDEMTRNISFLRSVRPEASVTIDGRTFDVGGLTGQPIHNYLDREWISELKADPKAFKMVDFKVEKTKERFPWKRRPEWMPRDLLWPVPGKELVFTYQLSDEAIGLQAPGADYLKKIKVNIHYELYDNLPVFCKWMTVENHSGKDIVINSFKSEILAAIEPESAVDAGIQWMRPNITVETDYQFGGIGKDFIYSSSVAWKPDPLYKTQVNFTLETPCLLEASPRVGPEETISSGEVFHSFRTWELLNDSWERERKSLSYRRMMRSIAPWATENPILMHVRNADNAAVKKAIDQCAEVGFEMVIITFGSGFNAEDESPENLERLKELADYAHAKKIALGGYSLLASRSINKENDVVLPEGQLPRFNHSPCLESRWGQDYFRKLYNLYKQTGLDVLEHDGSYPGDLCYSTSHPGHQGVANSQWNQFRRITDFYKWCRGQGIYLNVPDLYFLNGSNKTGMGYREKNWSLPRPLQEIIERQNIFDGTWEKTPSMGWMFVPLVEYQGGGKAATIEPLKEHLPHYGQRLANLFGAGVQACYRGPQLYDAPETKELLVKWVGFYKAHREVLDSDIIHVRRPDGRDYDAILHVNPNGNEKGLLMVYNPLDKPIRRKLKVNLYYTGLRQSAKVIDQNGKVNGVQIDSDNNAVFNVDIPAKSQTWFVLK